MQDLLNEAFLSTTEKIEASEKCARRKSIFNPSHDYLVWKIMN
jgi:hypothetical protein